MAAFQSPVGQLRELALFAGAGGGILAGHLLGWRCVCAVEWDSYAASVLVARQNDGCLPPFPIWDDVQTFDGRPWRGLVDVVSGGFPCQDISAAGKGAGIDGNKSGMWRYMARIVGEVRPRYVFVENSPLLVGRGLARVLGDFAALGYDARWGVVGAHHAGAPHKRDRIWVLADAKSWKSGEPTQPQGRKDFSRGSGDFCENVADAESVAKRKQANQAYAVTVGRDPRDELRCGGEHVADADSERQQEQQPAFASQPQHTATQRRGWWNSEPYVGGVVDGMAAGVDIHGAHAGINVGRVATGVQHRTHRLRCLGNGQVPAAATLAINIIT